MSRLFLNAQHYYIFTIQAIAIQLSISTCKKDFNAVEMSDAKPIGRPMKYPYTFSAKIAQFPLKFYIQKQWIWRYWVAGIVVASPVFYKIHKMANSPENVKKWAEIRRKEAAEHH